MSVRTDTVNLIVNVNGSKAQNELNELRKVAADLTFEMKNNLKKGTEEYIAASAKLKNVNKDMAELKQQIGITALSQKELTAELNKLKALRGSVVPFSKEFKDLSAQISTTEKRLYDVRNNVTGLASVFSKVKDEIKQFGALALGYLGFQFLSAQFKNIIQGAGKLSDQLADLRRVAGLTGEEAQKLSASLGKIDTRTSVTALRDIAIVAGKLGVAKDDIFGFTKAVDQLVVSLGDELGDADQITTSLGKILNVFDGKVTGDNITKLGNAFVELANTGAATGGFIAEFDQRLSGIAKSAGISLGALSGLGAGLEEMGSRVESSTTAIQKLIIHISGDVPKAAKVAGESLEEFTKLLKIDPTEAILRYSQGLVKNKESFSEVVASFKDAGEEGARVIETISKLGSGADKLRERIDLGKKSIEESTAITAAFALKNETLGAALDKLGKEFYAFVMSSGITTFLKDSVAAVIDFIKWLKELPTFINENRITIGLLIASFIALKIEMIKTNALWLLQRGAVIAATVAQYAISAATLVYRVALLSLAAVQALVTGNIGRARAAWELLNRAFKTSGIGVVVAAVIALGIALDNAFSKTTRLQKAQNDLSKQAIENYGDQVNKLEELKRALEDESIGLDTKKKLLQELIAINPEFAETLRLDAQGHLQGADAINQYITALKKKGTLEAAQSLSSEQQKKIFTAQATIDQYKNKKIGLNEGAQLANAVTALKEAEVAKKYFDDKIQDLYKDGLPGGTLTLTQPADTVIGGGKAAVDASVAARRAFLTKQIEDLKAKYELLNETDKKGQTSNLALRKKYQDELDALDGKSNKTGGGPKSKNTEYDRLKKEAAEFYKELLKLKEAAENASKSDDEKEIIALQDKYDALHAKALEYFKKNVTDRKTYTAEEKLIVEAFNKEMAELQKKFFAKTSEEDYAKSLTDTSAYFEQQRIIAGNSYAAGEIDKAKYSATLKDIDAREKAQLVRVAEDYVGTSKKATADLLKFKVDAQKAETANAIEEAENRIAVAKQEALAKAQLDVLKAPEGSKKRKDAEKALAQEKFDQDTKDLDKRSQLYLEREAELQEALKQIDDDYTQRKLQAWDDFAQQLLSITSTLFQALDNLDTRQYNKDKKLNEAKKNNYKKQLDGKLLSQSQYDKKVAKADEELAKKKHELDLKSFKRQQALAITGALINGAMAVTSTLAARPGLADIFTLGAARAIQIGLIVAATAAQVATIATQQPPEAAEGNWFRQGPKHRDKEGGIPVMIERDEAVIKADTMTDRNQYTVTGTPSQITSKLNSMHGGVNWDGGAQLSPKFRERPAQLNTNLPRIMEQGGVVRSIAGSASAEDNSRLLQQLIAKQDELISEVKNQKDRLHAVVSIKEYRNEEKKYDNARKASGLGG